jgi:hypothetical protein
MTFLIFLLSIPAIISLIFSYPLIIKVLMKNTTISLFFILGFFSYLFIHIKRVAYKNINYFYILVHELTHAIFGIFSLNIPRRIKIKKTNGYVEFNEKTNSIIAISPYIFPLVNIFLFFVFIFLNPETKKIYLNLFLFLQGFFLSFHITNTLEVMTLNQKDFKYTGGRTSSILLILTLNLLIIAIFSLIILSKTEHIIPFLKRTLEFYIIITKKTFVFFINLFSLIFIK